VKHGVDLYNERNNVWISLLYACRKGHEDIVKYLIDKTAEKMETFYNKNNKYNNEKDIFFRNLQLQ